MPDELKQIIKRAHAAIEQMEKAAEQARKLALEAKRCLDGMDHKPEEEPPQSGQ
jgi:hypothetical protein